MAVQLGVGHRAGRRSMTVGARTAGGAGSTPARHRRRSTTGCPRARPSRPRPGERRLQLAPRPRRVVEPHSRQYRTPVRRTQVRFRQSAGCTHSTGSTYSTEVGGRPSLPERRSPPLLLDARRRQQLGCPLPLAERRGQQPEAAIHRAEVPCSRQRHPRAAVGLERAPERLGQRDVLGGEGDGGGADGDLAPRHRCSDEQLRLVRRPRGDVGDDVDPTGLRTRQPERSEQRR